MKYSLQGPSAQRNIFHKGYAVPEIPFLFISLRCSMIFSSMERASSRRFVLGIPCYAAYHLNCCISDSVALMQAG
jgi:hypothetical protein